MMSSCISHGLRYCDSNQPPVASDVAVAMAGMILPAISFAFNLSTSCKAAHPCAVNLKDLTVLKHRVAHRWLLLEM